jgi:ribosomal protein S18 acetylase RimI-like enzyme
MNIRRYLPEDSDRVYELHEEALRAVGGFIEEIPEPDLEDVEQSYIDQGGEFLVGEIGGRIVAMGAFRPAEGYIADFLDTSDNTAEIKRMRVDPAHQRQGYGQSIHDELERRARECGFIELVLDTTPQQIESQHFFEKNSFDAVRRERLQPREEVFELIFYRKSFTENV